MNFYINTKEASSERPHVHVGKTARQTKSDMKIWLDNMGIAKEGKNFKAQEKKDAYDTACALRLLLLADYEKIHGKSVARKKK